MDADVRDLADRVARLETEVGLIKTVLPPVIPAAAWTTPVAPTPSTGATPLATGAVPGHAVPARPGIPAAPAPDPEREARLVGTWFARLGAAAILLGAAFGFKYAVDRGLIGPTGRVAIGTVAGLMLLLVGERARARAWPRLAQALAGGGIGLLYLSVWAAFGLYHLIPAGAAFVLLACTVAGGVVMALRHDSEALAVLALAGGFLDPYLTGLSRVPGPLFGFVLLLDAGVVALSVSRRWRLLEAAALAKTWLVVAIATEAVDPGLVQGFATIVFVLFSSTVLVRTVAARRTADALDVALVSANAVAFFGVGMVLLGDLAPGLRAEFTLLLAATFLGLGLLVRRYGGRQVPLWGAFLVLGVAFATTAVPLELDGLEVALVWALEGLLLLAAGRMSGLEGARIAGLAMLGLSLADSLVVELGGGLLYRPPRLLFSFESLVLVAQVAALYGAAWLLSREPGGWRTSLVPVLWVGANLLTLGWLSLEARAAFGTPSLFEEPRRARALQFSYTAIWALYAGVILGVGVAARSRGLRLLAVAIFGGTIFKMVVVDLWLLEPLHRTLAFTGLGLLLLLGSLMYHRFRDLILEGR
jgi:uncharacterized membrane protein